MEIEFYGAIGGVTGSCHIIRLEGRTLLLDCGMIQGGRRAKEQNRQPFPFDPSTLDAVVLSHAHIDHSGRLPLLLKEGFSGPIYTHNATRDLCHIMLRDSANLTERDARYENKRRARKGLSPVEPLYSEADAEAVLTHFNGLRYGEVQEILPGVRLRFQDAGHIMGSASVELWLKSGESERKVVFSGDIGQYDSPILNDPSVVDGADVVLIESTYGNRLHRERDQTINEIGEIVQQARHEKGNILIPAFAVGRSQEVLYQFGMHREEWEMDRWNIFLDSPMAIEASKVYWDYPHLYDSEATRFRRELHEMPRLGRLHFTRATKDSMAINRIRSGAIIIAGSGMCTGGRILHHFKHNLWRKQCHVIIVGYQSYGTMGRRLVEGKKHVKIYGEEVRVAAQVHTVGGLSAHADQNDLVRWLRGVEGRPKVFVVHGEAESKSAFRDLLEEQGYRASVPELGERVGLLDD